MNKGLIATSLMAILMMEACNNEPAALGNGTCRKL